MNRRTFFQALIQHRPRAIPSLYTVLKPDRQGEEAIAVSGNLPLVTGNPDVAASVFAVAAQQLATKHRQTVELVRFTQRESVKTFTP